MNYTELQNRRCGTWQSGKFGSCQVSVAGVETKKWGYEEISEGFVGIIIDRGCQWDKNEKGGKKGWIGNRLTAAVHAGPD